MLKIKDEVDLRELEKFGFDVVKRFCSKTLLEQGYEKISINVTQQRIINIDVEYGDCQGSSCLYEELETLYDLIQAGLVEKIGG